MSNSKLSSLPTSLPSLQLPNSTAVERIYAASIEEAENPGSAQGLSGLSAADKLINAQLETAWSLRQSYHTFEQAWPLMAKQYGIARATCFRRLADAQNLMGDLAKVKKQGARALLIEQAEKIQQLCLSQRPPDVRGALAAMKFKATLQGLHRADTGPENAEIGSGSTAYILHLTVEGPRGPKLKQIDLGKLDSIQDADYELVQQAVQQNVIGVDVMTELIEQLEGEEGPRDAGN